MALHAAARNEAHVLPRQERTRGRNVPIEVQQLPQRGAESRQYLIKDI